jgi:molecular chaperone GrpE
MNHDEYRKPRPVRVTDRRISSREGEQAPSPRNANPEFAGEEIGAPEAPVEALPEEKPEETIPLDDYLRLQADFDNRRKRMMRETAMASDRAKRELFEKLLPVLDNFDRAKAHADDPSGLEIVHSDLLSTLEKEGLAEIPAEGLPFDYHVHDAMASHVDPDVTEETVAEVLLKGYRLGDDVLRHAKVVVARPVDDGSNEKPAEGQEV